MVISKENGTGLLLTISCFRNKDVCPSFCLRCQPDALVADDLSGFLVHQDRRVLSVLAKHLPKDLYLLLGMLVRIPGMRGHRIDGNKLRVLQSRQDIVFLFRHPDSLPDMERAPTGSDALPPINSCRHDWRRPRIPGPGRDTWPESDTSSKSF